MGYIANLIFAFDEHIKYVWSSSAIPYWESWCDAIFMDIKKYGLVMILPIW